MCLCNQGKNGITDACSTEDIFIRFHPLSFTFIQGGLHWSVSDHHKVIFNAQTNVGRMDGLEISER